MPTKETLNHPSQRVPVPCPAKGQVKAQLWGRMVHILQRKDKGRELPHSMQRYL